MLDVLPQALEHAPAAAGAVLEHASSLLENGPSLLTGDVAAMLKDGSIVVVPELSAGGPALPEGAEVLKTEVRSCAFPCGCRCTRM